MEDSWPQTLTNSVRCGPPPSLPPHCPEGECSLSAQTALWYLEQDSRVGDQGGLERHLWEGMPARKPRSEHLGGFWRFLRLGVGDLGSQTSAPPVEAGSPNHWLQGSPNIWQFLRELGPPHEGGNKGQPHQDMQNTGLSSFPQPVFTLRRALYACVIATGSFQRLLQASKRVLSGFCFIS